MLIQLYTFAWNSNVIVLTNFRVKMLKLRSNHRRSASEMEELKWNDVVLHTFLNFLGLFLYFLFFSFLLFFNFRSYCSASPAVEAMSATHSHTKSRPSITPYCLTPTGRENGNKDRWGLGLGLRDWRPYGLAAALAGRHKHRGSSSTLCPSVAGGRRGRRENERLALVNSRSRRVSSGLSWPLQVSRAVLAPGRTENRRLPDGCRGTWTITQKNKGKKRKEKKKGKKFKKVLRKTSFCLCSFMSRVGHVTSRIFIMITEFTISCENTPS